MPTRKIIIFPSVHRHVPDCVRDLLRPALKEQNPCNRPHEIIEKLETIALPFDPKESWVSYCKKHKDNIFTWSETRKDMTVYHYIGWANHIGTPYFRVCEIDTDTNYMFLCDTSGAESLAPYQMPQQLSNDLKIYSPESYTKKEEIYPW